MTDEILQEAAAHSETHSEVGSPKEGLPQFGVIADGSYTNQLVWLFLSFALLYILIARRVVPQLSRMYEERESRLQNDLGMAEKARDQAEAARLAYETMVQKARLEAQTLVLAAKKDIQTEISNKNAELDRVFAGRISEAETVIAKAKDAAATEIEPVVAEIAALLVEKINAPVNGQS